MDMKTISRKANEFVARITADGYQATARDVAESQELVNQYIDVLERLENTATVKPFTDADKVADKILSWWYPND